VRTGFSVGALCLSLLLVACGTVTPELPTGPSPDSSTPATAPAAPAPPADVFPSLVGRWRTAGTNVVYRNRETGTTPGSYSCQGSLTIESQGGRTFSGLLSTDGNGWNSDRFCTGGGTLIGEVLMPGTGSARARLDGGFSKNQCTLVSAAGEFTGIARDAEIRLQGTDILRCPVNLDGGPGMPFVEFERTVTLAFARW